MSEMNLLPGLSDAKSVDCGQVRGTLHTRSRMLVVARYDANNLVARTMMLMVARIHTRAMMPISGCMHTHSRYEWLHAL